MCDVMVALRDVTRAGSVVFAKNSDRPVGECQVLHFVPGGGQASGSVVHCSYLDVPQAPRTLATLGCRPYWCFGFETGINQAGVVGGNAAIFTRALYQPENQAEPGLTGMDLLRLGLERGGTAAEVVETITDLLGQYGQWGSAVAGASHEAGSYDNSYLIADAHEAWVLETAARDWVTRRLERGFWSISNEPTTRTDFTDSSDGFRERAEAAGWVAPEEAELDFARDLGAHDRYSRQVSHIRLMRTRQLLAEQAGRIDAAVARRILRDHYEETFLKGPQFDRFLPDFHTVCMHDSPAGFTWGNTATSWVVEIDPDGAIPPIVWFAYLPPCCSIYAAVPVAAGLPEVVVNTGSAGLAVHKPGEAPKDEFAADSLWWRLQRVVDAVAANSESRFPELRSRFDGLEDRHVRNVEALKREGHSAGVFNKRLAERAAEHVAGIMAEICQLESLWDIT